MSLVKTLSLEKYADTAINEYQKAMENTMFHRGLIAVWDFISIMNKYIDNNAPWALAKDQSQQKTLETVIYNLLEGLRVVSCLIYPVMPETSFKMQKLLGIEKEKTSRDNGADIDFYTLNEVMPWHQLAKDKKLEKPPILFPRIDPDTIKAKEMKK